LICCSITSPEYPANLAKSRGVMGIFSCCKKPEGEAKPKSLKKRSCTDVLCLIIFILFLGILGGIFGLCLIAGDYTQLMYGADYLGNRCGHGTMASKPKSFYPRIAKDMLDQQAIVASGMFWNLNLYALCVEECPSTFDIDNATFIEDYGFNPSTSVTQAFGSGTQPLWLSATPTLDIANRCLPAQQSTQGQEIVCAYPKCTTPEALAVGAICTNSSTFDNGEWTLCPDDTTSTGSGSSNPITLYQEAVAARRKCTEQTQTCKVRARYTATTTHELSTSDDTSAAMLATISSTVGGIFEIMSSVYSASSYIIVGGVIVPVVLAFLYMLLLFLFAKIIIYTLLVMLIIVQLVATFVCFSRSGISFQGVDADTLISTATASTNVSVPSFATDALATVNEDSQWMYSLGFLVLAVSTVITIITVITARKKIRICAAIIKEATTVFTHMPLLMVFPTNTTIVMMGVSAWFVAQMLLINTTKPESLDVAMSLVANATEMDAEFGSGLSVAAASEDAIAGVRGLVSSEWYKTGCFVITLYGFFTLMQFVQGVAWCTMSGATYYWYFFRKPQSEEDKSETTKWPIIKSLGRTVSYHTGSIAFAAFVIALCDMLRAGAQYLEKQMDASGAKKNFMVKMAFVCLHCALNCLKKTVKFVSYYGLVFVACQGTNFCLSCYKTFFFFVNNAGQVAINATVTWLLKVFAMLSSPLFTALVFYYIMDLTLPASQNAIYPTLIIFILAAVMTQCCMQVFECTITTIFVCCFQDKAEFDSKYMSDRLAKAFGIKKGKEDKADGKKDGKKDDKKEEEKQDSEAVQTL